MDSLLIRRRAMMGGAKPIYVTASGSVASFETPYIAPLRTLIANIVPVQSGTGDPSPTNVRPITGWTGATVYRSGKNLLSMKAYVGGSYNPTIGTVWNLTEGARQFSNPSLGVYTIEYPSTWSAVVLICPVKQNQYYHVSYSGSTTSGIGRTWGYLDKNFTVLTKSNDTTTSFSYDATWIPGYAESTKKAAYIYLLITNRSSAGAVITINNPQIELGSTATEFVPYTGASYPITWESAGTVYGGTLTVNQDGAGALVVKASYFDLGDLTWTKDGAVYYASRNDRDQFVNYALCSDYGYYGNTKYNTIKANVSNGQFGLSSASAQKYIIVRNDSFTDAADAKAKLTGIKMCYPLATPVTYNLTALQVIQTLQGQNNVWTDISDISVEYKTNA